MTPPLGDAIARARGLARHLLSEPTLERLAGSGGSAALAAELARLGHPVPDDAAATLTGAEALRAAIEAESARRLGVVARWLGRRRALFACIFEDEERRVLRALLRRALAGSADRSPPPRTEALLSLPAPVRADLARAGDASRVIRILRRARSPWAPPLAATLRKREADPLALEGALDATWAARARRGARRGGSALVAWVAEEIDLENAWSLLLGVGGELEGGRRLPRELRDLILREPEPSARREQLARAFAGSAPGDVLADPEVALHALERRVRHARERACTRAARLDPLGPLALLEILLRLREETARLRRIGLAVAQGVPEPAAFAPGAEAAP
jgi:hypothetical protein